MALSRQVGVSDRSPTAYEPRGGSLADVLDVILDKGIVIDAYVRVSVIGIELLTIDARIVVASIDTYLHFAQATNRLELGGERGARRSPVESIGQQGDVRSRRPGILQAAGEGLQEGLSDLGRAKGRPAGGVVGEAIRAARATLSGAAQEVDEGEDRQRDDLPQGSSPPASHTEAARAAGEALSGAAQEVDEGEDRQRDDRPQSSPPPASHTEAAPQQRREDGGAHSRERTMPPERQPQRKSPPSRGS
jgi:hypothetical protein